MDHFRRDLSQSSLLQSPAADLDDLCLQYDSALKSLLDKHAPLCTKIVSQRRKAPWYNDVIRRNKAERRKLERRWRKSKLTIDRDLFVEQSNLVKN